MKGKIHRNIYFSLLNEFWAANAEDPLPPAPAMLYMYLLQRCNKAFWVCPLEIPTKEIEAELGMTRKAIAECREVLKGRGLISFTAQKRPCRCADRGEYDALETVKAPRYTIAGVARMMPAEPAEAPAEELPKETEDEKKEFLTETLGEGKRVSVGNTSVSLGNSSVSLGNTHSLYIYKDIKTNKTPPNPLKGERGGEGSLFADKDFREEKPKRSPAQYPTSEQVRQYFLSQHADERLDDWRTQADIFFANFDAVGWIDSRGRHIKRWESRANRWIMEKEQEQKKQKDYARQRDKAYADRRGVDSDSKKEKQWTASF